MQGHCVKYDKVSWSKGTEVNIYYTFYTYYWFLGYLTALKNMRFLSANTLGKRNVLTLKWQNSLHDTFSSPKKGFFLLLLLFEIFLKCLCVMAKSSSSVCKQWKRLKSLSLKTCQFCSILSWCFHCKIHGRSQNTRLQLTAHFTTHQTVCRLLVFMYSKVKSDCNRSLH